MRQLLLAQRLGAAEALGDVLARELEVDAAGPGALRRQAAKKPSISAMIASKRRVFAPPAVVKTLRVHRVAGPDDRVLGLGDRAQKRRQQLLDAVGAHARDERQPAGDTVGIEPLAELDDLVRRSPSARA